MTRQGEVNAVSAVGAVGAADGTAPPAVAPATVAELLLARSADDSRGLCQAGDPRPPWTWRQVVYECVARGTWLHAAAGDHVPPAVRERPLHAGVLLRNIVRITKAFPQTATNKILKRELVAQAWFTSDPVWCRPARPPDYRLLTDRDTAENPRGI